MFFVVAKLAGVPMLDWLAGVVTFFSLLASLFSSDIFLTYDILAIEIYRGEERCCK